MVLSSQLSNQLSNHLIFGPSSKALQRLVEDCSIGTLLVSFGASARLPSCFFCSPLPSGEKRPKTGQKQASSAPVGKRAQNAVRIIFAASRKRAKGISAQYWKNKRPGHKKSGQTSRPTSKNNHPTAPCKLSANLQPRKPLLM